MKRDSMVNRTLALLLAFCLSAPQLLEARYKPTTGRNAFSTQQEIEVGQQAAAETDKKMPLLPENDPISRYISNLGQRLAAKAPGDKWPYRFRVVRQKEINAFALPGGPIYINVGTIQAAENEAQLAGVMAHEIAHVVQRHATRAATKQMYAQVPLAVLGGLLGRSSGIGAQLAQLGVSFGVGSYFLKNSRTAEREADLIGADILWDSGYDPRQMAIFFEALEAEGGGRGPEFLSDHPNPGNRARDVGEEARSLGSKQFRNDSAEFRQIRARAAGLKAPSAQELAQGQSQNQNTSMGNISRQDVMPSGKFQTLSEGPVTLEYPTNWQVMGDRASGGITIAPPAGVSQNAVAYGVIVNGFQPSAQGSLDDAMQELLASIQKSNPDIRPIGSAQPVRVNGVDARSIDLVGTSPVSNGGNAARERDWLVSLKRKDGSVLYFVFVAPENDFSALRPTFERMLRSVRLR